MTGADPIAEFKSDHRKVRDGIMVFVESLNNQSFDSARSVLEEINLVTGPHFRYEEESLFPALRKFLGNHVDDLRDEHTRVIESARKCRESLKAKSLTRVEVEHCKKAAVDFLVHVSNCDGLAIVSELLSRGELDALAEKFAASKASGVALIEWADSIRKA